MPTRPGASALDPELLYVEIEIAKAVLDIAQLIDNTHTVRKCHCVAAQIRDMIEQNVHFFALPPSDRETVTYVLEKMKQLIGGNPHVAVGLWARLARSIARLMEQLDCTARTRLLLRRESPPPM